MQVDLNVSAIFLVHAGEWEKLTKTGRLFAVNLGYSCHAYSSFDLKS
jgi:hypothetical protein